jgi:hypothetical protein
LNHCVYCGEVFPPEWKAGLAEPESLKWVDRPAIPADAAKQLEMMKVIPMEGRGPGRGRGVVLLAGLSIPIFAGLFYLIYRILARYSAASATLVLVAGAGFLAYLGWTLFKRSS